MMKEKAKGKRHSHQEDIAKDPRELISTKDEETLDVQLMYAAVVQVSKLV